MDSLAKMEMRVNHDLYYIRNRSFWLDLNIETLSVFSFVIKHACGEGRP